jgi:uncharacterized membrane protein (DUF485 family)
MFLNAVVVVEQIGMIVYYAIHEELDAGFLVTILSFVFCEVVTTVFAFHANSKFSKRSYMAI